jgi:hypothetical protein
MGEEAIRFVDTFMKGRSCRLQYEGVISESIEWMSELPQGSPLSPILFLLYNSRLLKSCRSKFSMA